MTNKLYKYKAWIYVPDAENMLNYKVKGSLFVEGEEYEEKVRLYIREHIIPEDHYILSYNVKEIPSI